MHFQRFGEALRTVQEKLAEKKYYMNANLGLGNQMPRKNGGCCIGNNMQRRTLGVTMNDKEDCSTLGITKDDDKKECGCKKNMNTDCGCGR